MYNMKTMILVILFLLSFISLSVGQETIMRKISIDSKTHETKFKMKIEEDIRCTQYESLSIDSMNLTILKDHIIQSNGIRQVSAQKNLLKNIPHNVFKNVPRLSCLDLSENKINLYKSNFFEHPALRILNLGYQRMPKLSQNFPELTNVVEEIDELYKLMIFDNTDIYIPKLKYLILSGNDISMLSWTFNESFPELTHLYLDNINATKLDPDFFNKIPKSLRVLHLENNYLPDLVLHDLAEITDLYLDSNPLTKIELMSEKLTVLSLSNCIKLKNGTLDTPALQYLDLSMNKLSMMPDIEFDNYEFLNTILLDYNRFSYVPVITSVQLLKLSLNYNMITYIHENSFKYLRSLEKLSLRGNKINGFDENAFLDLRNLKYLDLSENKLKNLASNWMLPLTNLHYLNISSNGFENLSDMSVNLMSSLQHMFVKNNAFSSVTTLEMANLPNWITVYLN